MLLSSISFRTALLGLPLKKTKKLDLPEQRSLRVVYEDSISTFEELLKMDIFVSIHHLNAQLVAVEMFKIKYGL